MTSIPREAVWPDAAVFMGTGAWISLEAWVKYTYGKLARRTRDTGEKEFGVGEVFTPGQLARGVGLSASLVAFIYSGLAIVDGRFAAWAAGHTVVFLGLMAWIERTKILEYLAPERFGYNRGREFTADAEGSTSVSAEVSTEDESMYRCAQSLATP